MRQIALMLLLSVLAAVADTPKTPQARVDERKADIEKMKEQDRGEAYAKLALDLAELASEQYKAGNIDDGHKTMAQVSDNAIKAYHAAAMKHKKIKQTELALRQLSTKLDGIRRTLSVADQGPIKETISKVDQARADVLEAMFKK
jgi:hypothetical protein